MSNTKALERSDVKEGGLSNKGRHHLLLLYIQALKEKNIPELLHAYCLKGMLDVVLSEISNPSKVCLPHYLMIY